MPFQPGMMYSQQGYGGYPDNGMGPWAQGYGGYPGYGVGASMPGRTLTLTLTLAPTLALVLAPTLTLHPTP